MSRMQSFLHHEDDTTTDNDEVSFQERDTNMQSGWPRGGWQAQLRGQYTLGQAAFKVHGARTTNLDHTQHRPHPL